MLINPFTGVVNAAQSGTQKGANRLQAAVSAIASGSRIQRAADDVANLSVATKLQNEISSLRTALGNTAQLSSLLQVADNDVGQIQSALGNLKQLATQAQSGTLSDENRAALDAAFQQGIEAITQIAQNSRFGGVALLDGSLNGDNAISLGTAFGDDVESTSLAIDALDATSLLGGALDIRTQEGAEQALDTIQQALNQTGTVQAGIGAFAEQTDFASAYLETAIANQDAARSLLTDADFATAATELSQASLQQQAGILATAQAKRLPPSMLELIG